MEALLSAKKRNRSCCRFNFEQMEKAPSDKKDDLAKQLQASITSKLHSYMVQKGQERAPEELTSFQYMTSSEFLLESTFVQQPTTDVVVGGYHDYSTLLTLSVTNSERARAKNVRITLEGKGTCRRHRKSQ